MHTPLAHPERVAIARLHALLELLPTALDKRLRPAGITAFEYTLLETLAEADGQRMRMSEVAAKTNASLPRLSRVANSLERRGLTERSACAEDARATNLVLTELGAEAYRLSQELYATAVRELILDGLENLPGDGIAGLSSVTYAVLSSLDPRGASTAAWSPQACAADPAAESADSAEDQTCVADPVAPADTDEPEVCAADPLATPERELAQR
ncbi:MarR family winged helix-turn-helix transcriptional regulator [Leucobacter denitrificans]|uniref:MarR family transcriptional regulator n=1 Tax=Leucobacter denitrificans TaxID=683042 RepID=A0A7G9S6Y7_9MICO|nr:MarR family transcriptional regulator [Leucobacter denitrificans]QNN63612.1 MarR family transcriptional regulator [Leucobacter denitrificans]